MTKSKKIGRGGARQPVEIITKRILKLMEKGVVPWQQPWHEVCGQRAPKSIRNRLYRGANALLLASAPYRSRYWLTFHQALELDGCVRAGEQGWPQVFSVVRVLARTQHQSIGS